MKNLNVLKITIVKDRAGSDFVLLETNLPNPVYPYNGNMCVDFRCAKGTAADYCKTHFESVPLSIVEG